MRLDFDVREFCQNLRATKPPYECPVKECGKIYKSFAGIQFHLFNFNHDSVGSCLSQSPQQALTYAEARKIVELEVEGRMQRINVYDSLVFVSKEDFDLEKGACGAADAPDGAKTPASSKGTSIPKSLQKKSLKMAAAAANAAAVASEVSVRKEEKVTVKLPEASFSVIESWNLLDAPERPKSYYRFIEKTGDELEDEVEYDMDEDDFTWLEFVNKQRRFENLSEVSPESFELLMDRLEKESYFQMLSTGTDQGPPIDEDAVCCICMDGECQNSNVILFCDMCNLAVHQECYGVPYIPEGQWLCRRCLQSPSRAVDCALCPNRGGAFKQTDDSRWAHVVCALWIPEVCFANTVFLEPIDSIQNIPAARWKLICYICKQRGAGACIQCHRANCYTAFHVTCAQQAGLHMKIDAVKDSGGNGPSVSVRKTAYCDAHTPADSDCKPNVGAESSLGETIRKAQSKAAFRDKMRKARKILAEKRSAAPIISIPTIPPERVQEIATSIEMQGKIRFIQRLIAYWTLKRQSRNGVPLLRRLQTTHPSRRTTSEVTPDAGGGASASSGGGAGSSVSGTGAAQAEDVMTQLRYFQRLRQDLERARLLCELIRKREKTKRELMKVKEKELELRLYPLQYLLRRLLQQIKEKDTSEIFAEPVDVNEVPDYLDFIKVPMDLSTMQQKLDSLQYTSVEHFDKDLQLMIHNCTIYNAQHTMYYRAAIKLKEAVQPLFRQLRRDLETIHLTDSDSQQQLEQQLEQQQRQQQQDSINEIDNYLSDKKRELESLEQQLSRLEELLAKAQQLTPGQAKVKRIRSLRNELAKVRRKLSLQAGGRAAATRSSSPSKTKTPQQQQQQQNDASSSSSNSSSSSSSGSDSSSSDSASYSEREVPVVKKRMHQVKIDAFVSRIPKNDSAGAESGSGSGGGNSSSSSGASSNNRSNKNKLVAKVMKKNRETPVSAAPAASTPAASTSVAKSKTQPELESTPLQLPVTPVKSGTNPSANLSGSPSGVNRRTAVLFTKKAAAAAAFKKPEGSTSPARRNIGRPRKTVDPTSATATNTTTVPSPAPPASATPISSTTNLFVAAATIGTPAGVVAPVEATKRKKQKVADVGDKLFSSSLGAMTATTPAIAVADVAALPNIERESFKVYRTQGFDDDDDSNRASSCGSSSSDSSAGSSDESEGPSSDDSESSSSSDDDESNTSNPAPTISGATAAQANKSAASNYVPIPCSEIPLQPLDLVWAKCRGYPWYPALIVDPAWPKSGYVHNGVPIAIPPDDVLALRVTVQQPSFLVLFFDAKRTWQWLPRIKLEPLGVDPDLDKAKLVESKKQTERKAVKKAFEEAILHQCRVAGQSGPLSDDSNSSNSSQNA